jgi:uncharacterized repeat protein (TIGR01451 family)
MDFRTTLKLLALALALLPALAFGQKQYSPADVSRILTAEQSNLKLESSDFSEFEITNQYTDDHNGITHIYLQQKHNNLRIFGAYLGIHLAENGEVVHLGNRFFPHKNEHIRFVSPRISPAQALKSACSHLGIQPDVVKAIDTKKSNKNKTVFQKGEFSVYDVPVELIIQPLEDHTLVPAYQVEVYTKDEQHYWVLKVDTQTGAIIGQSDLVISCSFAHEGAHEAHGHQHSTACLHKVQTSEAIPAAANAFEGMNNLQNFYRVYDRPVEAPSFGGRTMVGTGGDPVASPLGWHNDGIIDHFITKGNNVFAYVDPGPASTPIPTIGGLPGQQPLVFDFPIDFGQFPQLYKDASVTNLFYWNNLIHDVFYHYGFTEVAGNFQQNNLSNGGAGLDAVLAEAQDGSGVNNANFLTLPDGLPGRMQMFLWDTNIPLIDGDLDNGVIVHEYGHGISTRLTGGPAATCLGGDEQGGEGWSDYFGLIMTMNNSNLSSGFNAGRGIGTYVLNEPTSGNGIRPARYSIDFNVNDYTYADINNAEISAPHGVGFIWCTMLWEMTNLLVDQYGFDNDLTHGNGGNNIALQLVVDGLKLQPCSPTFVEMRDAILAADQINNNGANQCLIWEAFAKRGLGFSASSGSNARGDEVEAFDLPPSLCMPTIQVESEMSAIVPDNSTMDIHIKLINNAPSAISGITVADQLPAGTSFVSSSAPASVSGNTVTFSNQSVAAGQTKTLTITVAVNTGSQGTILFADDMENGPFNFDASFGLNQFIWTNTDAASGQYSWFAVDPDNFSDQKLALSQSIPVSAGTMLQFTHRYNTEADFDGGVVEASTDGIFWNDIGSLIVQNGYSNFVPTANNPLIDGFAYGGNSNGFLTSVADLSAFAGQNLQLRFRLSSDVATGGEGWYIDDVVIADNPEVIVNTVNFSMANGAITGQVVGSSIVVGSANQGASEGQQSTLPEANYNTNIQSALDIQVFPNPARDLANLNIQGLSTGRASVAIQNLQGQTMYQNDLNVNDSFLKMELNTSNWPAGMYMIRVSQNKQMCTSKLVVK